MFPATDNFTSHTHITAKGVELKLDLILELSEAEATRLEAEVTKAVYLLVRPYLAVVQTK